MSSHADAQAPVAEITRLKAELLVEQTQSASRIKELEEKLKNLEVEKILSTAGSPDPGLQAENDRLRQELAAKGANNVQHQEIDRLRQELVAREAIVVPFRDEIERLRQELAAKDVTIVPLQENNDRLFRELAAQNATILQLRQELASQNATILQLRQELPAKDATVARVPEKIDGVLEGLKSLHVASPNNKTENQAAPGKVQSRKEPTPTIPITDTAKYRDHATSAKDPTDKREGETDVQWWLRTRGDSPDSIDNLLGFLAGLVEPSPATAPLVSTAPTPILHPPSNYAQVIQKPGETSKPTSTIPMAKHELVAVTSGFKQRDKTSKASKRPASEDQPGASASSKRFRST